jgi:hypothetical protein
MAGSLFNSKSSETLLSSSSNAGTIGAGGAISFERFRPHPVNALQKGRLALVSIWFVL